MVRLKQCAPTHSLAAGTQRECWGSLAKALFLFTLTAVLAACASGDPVRVPGIEITDSISISVSRCRYLDTVYGTSGWYGVFAEQGIENARMSAFEKAKSLGATPLATHLDAAVNASTVGAETIVSA